MPPFYRRGYDQACPPSRSVFRSCPGRLALAVGERRIGLARACDDYPYPDRLALVGGGGRTRAPREMWPGFSWAATTGPPWFPALAGCGGGGAGGGGAFWRRGPGGAGARLLAGENLGRGAVLRGGGRGGLRGALRRPRVASAPRRGPGGGLPGEARGGGGAGAPREGPGGARLRVGLEALPRPLRGGELAEGVCARARVRVGARVGGGGEGGPRGVARRRVFWGGARLCPRVCALWGGLPLVLPWGGRPGGGGWDRPGPGGGSPASCRACRRTARPAGSSPGSSPTRPIRSSPTSTAST